MIVSCECVPCDECGGNGTIYLTTSGRYLGKYRVSDMDEMGECPDCYGYGITYMCPNCQQDELDYLDELACSGL